MTDAAPLTETPLEPTFPQAMDIAAQWLGLWEAGELSDEVLADRVAELVASRDGARGFFVVSLTGETPLMDRLPEPLVARPAPGRRGGGGSHRPQPGHEHGHDPAPSPFGGP